MEVRSPLTGANVRAIAAPSLLGVPEEAAGAKGGVAQGLGAFESESLLINLNKT